MARLLVLSFMLLAGASCAHAQAQSDDTASATALKLFEQGQDAHARGQLGQALELYEQALKLHNAFPEAEYQRATALLSLNRLTDAEQALRRAIALRSDWALPHATLGELLVRAARDREAATLLQRALELDPNNLTALVALAEVRTHTGNTKDALELLRRATMQKAATARVWIMRGTTERAMGDMAAAATSLGRALLIDPDNVSAHLERAALRIAARDFQGATEDLRIAEQQVATKRERSDAPTALRIANLYASANNKEAALRTLDNLDDAAKQSAEVVALRSDISGEADERSIAALEKLLQADPQNPKLLARLAHFYRTTNPDRAQQLYARAAELEPRNVDYAVGYAAALIQARRFAEAASILQHIIQIAPDNYPAHANLATALDELKQYPQALEQYEWISRHRPELAIVKFFIARAFDLSGQYPQALVAYEEFLQQADQEKNRLEIEKVNLRLPTLRNQVKRAGKSKSNQ